MLNMVVPNSQERLHRYGSSLIHRQQNSAVDYRERSFDLSISDMAGIDLDEDEDTLDSVRTELQGAQKKFEVSFETISSYIHSETRSNCLAALVCRIICGNS